MTGHGWLLAFAEWLQKECDRQVRKIMEHFRDKRSLTATIGRVQEGLSSKATAVEKYSLKNWLDSVSVQFTILTDMILNY